MVFARKNCSVFACFAYPRLIFASVSLPQGLVMMSTSLTRLSRGLKNHYWTRLQDHHHTNWQKSRTSACSRYRTGSLAVLHFMITSTPATAQSLHYQLDQAWLHLFYFQIGPRRAILTPILCWLHNNASITFCHLGDSPCVLTLCRGVL